MAKSAKITRKKQTGKAKSGVVKVRPKKALKSYKQAMSYLFEKTDYEKEKNPRYNTTTFNLKIMGKLLSLAGNPHKKVPTVHIAGTI